MVSNLNYGTMQRPVAFRPVRYGYGLVHWNGNDQPGEQEDTVPMRGSGVWAGWLDQPPADDCCTAHVRPPLLPAILLYPESTWTCSRGNVRRSSSNRFVFCWVSDSTKARTPPTLHVTKPGHGHWSTHDVSLLTDFFSPTD